MEYAHERAEEMKGLVDVVIKEEEMLKSKATTQVTKIRLEIENEHALELKRMREV